MAGAIDDIFCSAVPRIPATRYCNQFHCDLECRVDSDSVQMPCTPYQALGTREINNVFARQQTCERLGCCFVPELDPTKRNGPTPKLECYTKPFRIYSSWVPLAWEQCSANGMQGDPSKAKTNVSALPAPSEPKRLLSFNKLRSTDFTLHPLNSTEYAELAIPVQEVCVCPRQPPRCS